MIEASQNPLVNGGLILMLSGAAMALLREVPVKIYDWIRHKTTVSVTITDADPLFEWTKIWLDSLPYAKVARNLRCSLSPSDEDLLSENSKVMFTPSYGEHFFKYKGKYIWLHRGKEEAKAGGERKTPETINLTILGPRQQIIRELIDDIKNAAINAQAQKSRAFTSGKGWWMPLRYYSPRLLSTVDMTVEDKDTVISEIDKFLKSRKSYISKGIPYHLNFLFAGLPGTGKTSLATALSGHFGMNLYMLGLSSKEMDDNALIDLMAIIPPRSILLLEDIDAVAPERKSKKNSEDKGVTLSGLLNCLDGIVTPDGIVIIMTSNHPETMDKALLRPGRVDVRIDFKAATKAQMETMATRLQPGVDVSKEIQQMLKKKMTTAQVQLKLMSLRYGVK